MGVPKFFRYISERYPCLSELVRQNEIPEFDNMYLDMNGIIHNCSHPSDDVHFRLSEEQMFRDIFNYLELLFKMVKPRKLFFMAIDGVAPRAKMNQQRGRRFRSAKDAEMQEKAAKQRGELLPTETRFDSNCITPGTEFMVRLNEALRYFIKMKISTDPAWQHCEVILSGHETPGEGEHKIMEYIRYLQHQPSYDVNTRHCLYGLDADLVMLGLCTHEKHFSLLREEVKFGKQTRTPSSIFAIKFFLLHLSLLRDYLELEFSSIKTKLSFPYDMEKIIDDWILMGFLVGNDFIPNLPNLHINTGALPLLYEVYMSVMPQLDGYINNGGELNLERFEKFMEALAVRDKDLFASNYFDFKPLEKQDNTFLSEHTDQRMQSTDFDFFDMVAKSQAMVLSDDDSSISDGEMMEKDFYKHRGAYYIEKMNYKEMNEDVRREQTECYITAIQWNLYYYYRGVQSWSWFYPHHYAPFISDICNFKNLKIRFELGKPFLPFQQLLSVLPAASSSLLPEAYKKLMTDSTSTISHYYPLEFATDLNGKKQEWEAVVLIPFIDETMLLQEMSKCDHMLKLNEKARNVHNPMYHYKFSPVNQGSCEGIYDFVDVTNVYCVEERIHPKSLIVPHIQTIIRRTQETKLVYPGFPTLKHLKYTGDVRNIRVSVFDQPSRNDSMIIKIDNAEAGKISSEELAQTLIDKTVYVNWPFLSEAKVIKVSDNCNIYYIDKANQLQSTNNERWRYDVSAIQNHHMNRMGIDVGNINTIIHVVIRVGMEYVYRENMYILRKTYSNHEVAFPIQIVVQNVFLVFKQFEDILKTVDVFKVGTPIVMMVSPFFGCFGEVVDTSLIRKTNRIKVALTISEEPSLKDAKDIHYALQRKYINSICAATEVGISDLTLQRITDTVLYVEGARRETLEMGTQKRNLAVPLKSKKNNEVTFGYTKKINKQWLYSETAIALIQEYVNQFPELVHIIEQGTSLVFDTDLAMENPLEKYSKKVLDWIKSKKLDKLEYTSATSDSAEKESVEKVIEATRLAKNKFLRRVLLQVKPSAVYVPHLNFTNQPLQENMRFRLFDRVLVSSKTEKPSLGQKGTIIATHHIADKNPVRQGNVHKADTFFDVLFDKPFDGGIPYTDTNEACVARISKSHLINTSCAREIDARCTADPRTRPQQPETTKKEITSLDNTLDQSSLMNTLWQSLKSNTSSESNSDKSKTNLQNHVAISNSMKKDEVGFSVSMKEDQASNALKALLGINKSKIDTTAKPMPPPPPESWKVATKLRSDVTFNTKIAKCDKKSVHMMPFIPLQVMRKAADVQQNEKIATPNPMSLSKKVIPEKSDTNVPTLAVPSNSSGRGQQRRRRRIAAKFKNLES